MNKHPASITMSAAEASGEGAKRAKGQGYPTTFDGSMAIPDPQKQKPAFWAGSLNKWCPDP
ncbi:hypothetical protein ACOZ06_003859, partial [Cronobacter muytjensii]